MKVTDAVLRKIVRDMGLIDFSQPGAHEVVRQIGNAIGRIITDTENIKDREVHFYSLGVAYAVAETSYRTIPPISIVPNPTRKEEAKE